MRAISQWSWLHLDLARLFSIAEDWLGHQSPLWLLGQIHTPEERLGRIVPWPYRIDHVVLTVNLCRTYSGISTYVDPDALRQVC